VNNKADIAMTASQNINMGNALKVLEINAAPFCRADIYSSEDAPPNY
jgi:hypothetical protein